MRKLLLAVVLLLASPTLISPFISENAELCTRLVGDGNILFCEDFENPALNDGGLTWTNKYGPPTSNCIPNNVGSTWYQGVEGTTSASCFNIVQETACEVGTDCVFEGQQALGHRFIPGSPSDGGGTANFAQTQTFGITYMVKYSSNFITPTVALKSNEFGGGNHCILGCSNWNFNPDNDPNNVPFSAIWFGSSTGLPSGQPQPVLIGHLVNVEGFAVAVHPDKRKYEWRGIKRAGDDADKVIFGPGEWGCFQTHYRNWGSASAEIRYWVNNKLIFHAQNVNMTGAGDAAGISSLLWDHYYNGGYPGPGVAYRFEDNVVVTRAAEPVTCAQVGYAQAGTLPPPPPAVPALAPPLVTPRCAVRVTGTPPDALGGWTMQAKNGTANIGTADTTAPYVRDVTLLAGPYSITLVWTKTGQASQVSPATTGTCP